MPVSPLVKPIWEGNVVEDESVLPIRDQNGAVAPMRLVYPADEIISVRSATHEALYTPGADYVLNNGDLVIPAGSRIPVTEYADYYPPTDDGKTFPRTGGGFIRFSETDYLHRRQIAVSYRHASSWTWPVPQDKSALLPRTKRLLTEGGRMNLLIFGDSIFTGVNASGRIGAPPFQPTWFDMVRQGLEDAFPRCAVNLTNTSVGGKKSDWGALTARENGAAQHPDLAVIGFGMNDGSGRVPKEEFIANLKTIMQVISADNPECEYILTATTLANGEVRGFLGCQEEYLAPMLALEAQGVCVADMTTLHKALLSRKAFRDITGNNVNHPNDFMSRVYAQLTLRTLGAL